MADDSNDPNDPKDAEMVYNPPPTNPPSPTAMAFAWLGALGALGALVLFEIGRADLAAGFAVAAQFLTALALAGMLYSGPPSNPPVPPRRNGWFAALAIGALGVALLGLRGGVLGFDGPVGFALVTSGAFAFMSGRARAVNAAPPAVGAAR